MTGATRDGRGAERTERKLDAKGGTRMPKVGEEITNAATGERTVFLQMGGELLVADDFLGADAPGPPEHLHPHQEERFLVRSGTMGVRVDGREITLGAGEEIVVPPGTPHTFRNAGAGELHLRIEMRPAGRFAEFIWAASALGRGGRIGPLGGGLLLHEYRDVVRPAGVPPLVARVVFPVLAAVARLLGVRLEAR